MEQLSLCLFGPLTVTLNNTSFIDFEYDKVRALLAYITHENQPQPRDTLCGLLWAEYDQSHARQSLSQALYSLRRSLAQAGAKTDYVTSNRTVVGINGAADWRSDVAEFQRRLQKADASGETMERITLWAQAAQLYRGPFLQGFHLPDSGAWDEWVLLQRERLHRLASVALRELAVYYRSTEQLEEALSWAEPVIQSPKCRIIQ